MAIVCALGVISSSTFYIREWRIDILVTYLLHFNENIHIYECVVQGRDLNV